MRHSQLKAFHFVALSGGFSRAAKALSLTQPAISEQVRHLEKEHDVLLFHRERKKVRLTKAGEDLFQLTERYFEAEAQIAGYMSETRAALEGKLRLVVDNAYHVTEILSSFRKRFPRVTVFLRTGNTEDVIAAVRSYNAEIGIAGSLSPGKDIEALDLGTTPIVAFASVDFLPRSQTSLSFQELEELPLVLREKGSRTRAKLDEEAQRLGVKLSPVIDAEGRETIRDLVASGAGIGFVSRAEFIPDTRLREIPLRGTKISMSESLIFLRQRSDLRVIRAFVREARAHLLPVKET